MPPTDEDTPEAPTAVREGRLSAADWEELHTHAERSTLVRLLKEALKPRGLVAYLQELGSAQIPIPRTNDGSGKSRTARVDALLLLAAGLSLIALGSGVDVRAVVGAGLQTALENLTGHAVVSTTTQTTQTPNP